MIEKPDIQDEEIVACLRDSYGIDVSGIKFLQLGNDSSAWVYRIIAKNGQVLFLKVKRGKIYPPSVLIPLYLREQGVNQVVGAIPTQTQQAWQPYKDFILLVYPFIEGEMGMEIGLTDSQWINYGSFLHRLHATRLPEHLLLTLTKETFKPKWSSVVRELQERIMTKIFINPYENELTAFWKKKALQIECIVDRAEQLGESLQKRELHFVLCHADIHTANLLLTPEGNMHVVDWDEVILAPKERDLMFIVGESIEGSKAESKEERLFFQGYGQTQVDPMALAYYRYEWAVQEIGDYGERVFLLNEVGDETRNDSVKAFIELFQPGNVVESAYRTETVLAAKTICTVSKFDVI